MPDVPDVPDVPDAPDAPTPPRPEYKGPLGALAHLDLTLEEIRRLIASMVGRLPQAERMVMSRRFGLGASGRPTSYTAIAREMGLSLEKVRLIEYSALRRLRRLYDRNQSTQTSQSTQTLAQEGDADEGRAQD